MGNAGSRLTVRIGDLKLSESERQMLYSLVDSEMFSEGRYIKEFERQWSAYVGTKHCVAFNSGTSAMMAGFAALQYSRKYGSSVKRGSRVITTPLTYVATVNSVATSNLEPVFVDVKDDFNIDEEKVAELLESSSDVSQYSIILPVHLLGYVCEMDRINSLARKHGLVVFEDAAEAHGSTYRGRQVGSLSTLSDFSFYMAHAVCAGELGTLHTSDDELASLAESLKGNGRVCCCTVAQREKGLCPHPTEDSTGLDPRYASSVIGFNFKATEFQGVLGLTQIAKLNEIIRKRQDNVLYLNEGLAKQSGVLQLPRFSRTVSYLSYPIVIRDASISRKKFRDALTEAGIESRPLFGSVPTQQPAYAHLKAQYEGKVPKADYFGSRGFYIGCHQFMPQEQLDYVIKTFGEIIRQLKR